MLVALGHLLISAEQVAGGIFTPANPEAQDEEERVASLVLLTPGGHIRVTDDAALFAFTYLVQHHGKQIGKLDYVLISKEAVETLQSYFKTATPSRNLAHSCKAIVDHLASRIA